ncbi:MAG: hypothetical protein WCW02_00415 [Candidatus Buchananbacteria bacterium]
MRINGRHYEFFCEVCKKPYNLKDAKRRHYKVKDHHHDCDSYCGYCCCPYCGYCRDFFSVIDRVCALEELSVVFYPGTNPLKMEINQAKEVTDEIIDEIKRWWPTGRHFPKHLTASVSRAIKENLMFVASVDDSMLDTSAILESILAEVAASWPKPKKRR